MALVVADEWEETFYGGAKRLRLTSSYTGSTYYLPDWDGDLEDCHRMDPPRCPAPSWPTCDSSGSGMG